MAIEKFSLICRSNIVFYGIVLCSILLKTVILQSASKMRVLRWVKWQQHDFNDIWKSFQNCKTPTQSIFKFYGVKKIRFIFKSMKIYLYLDIYHHYFQRRNFYAELILRVIFTTSLQQEITDNCFYFFLFQVGSTSGWTVLRSKLVDERCQVQSPVSDCRPSRSEFSVVFTETRVNTGYDPLERPPRKTLPLQTQVPQGDNWP